MSKKILVTTPIAHLDGVMSILSACKDHEIVYLPDPVPSDLLNHKDSIAIFTNPNKSRVYYSGDLLSSFPNLAFFCTASTGTNHIDKDYLSSKGIELISLTNERDIINQITSTAEHAFSLMLSALRNIPAAHKSVLRNDWDYEPFIGRQLNCQTVGIVGYGRLGNYFSQYLLPFGCKVFVYDPYKDVPSTYINKVRSLHELFSLSSIISLHVHVTDETVGMINSDVLSHASKDLLLVNTSRSDIVNEDDLAQFLHSNRQAKYATDVLSSELSSDQPSDSPFFRQGIFDDQLIITPHIAGMTKEGQTIAFRHAATLLKSKLTTDTHDDSTDCRNRLESHG